VKPDRGAFEHGNRPEQVFIPGFTNAAYPVRPPT
jgi:hypothetical protein